MTPLTPPRRWFRVSLKTFFVLLTLFCVWLGVQVKWMRDRHEALARNYISSASVGAKPAPLAIRALGEKGIEVIWTSGDVKQVEGLRRLFPEAEILNDPFPFGAVLPNGE